MSQSKLPSLEQIQQLFSKALRYQKGAESIGIITDRFTQHERLQIYRNNFVISLSEVLEAIYPVTLTLVGEECFNSIARYHVLQNPPLQGNVLGYGADFDTTIESLDNITSTAPYLADVARIESLFDQLASQPNFMTNQSVYSISELSYIPQHSHPYIVFELIPNLTLFQSKYALASLFEAIDSMHLDDLDINQAQSCVLSISHINDAPSIKSINPALFELLTCLQQSQPLSQIEPALLNILPDALASGFVQGFKLNRPI